MQAKTLPPLSLPFALLAGLAAHVTMCVAQTALLDADAHWIGLGIASCVGLGAGWLTHAVRRITRHRAVPIVVVLLSGMSIGMAMQLLLLVRQPIDRTYVLASGFSTREAWWWVLAGVPVGLAPSLLLWGVYSLIVRVYPTAIDVTGQRVSVLAEDTWERLMAPLAVFGTVTGAVSFGLAPAGAQLPGIAIVVLSAATALEIMLRDQKRASWLERVLTGRDPAYELMPLSAASVQVPLVVDTVTAQAVIVRVQPHAGYRSSSHEPLARTSRSLASAVAPLLRRRTGLLLANLLGVLLLLGGWVGSR